MQPHAKLRLLPILATLLVPATVAAQPAAAPTEAATGPAAGFAVELRLETGDFLIEDDFALPVTDAGILLGYQTARLTVGLGLDFGRTSQTRSSDGQEESVAVTTFLVVPGVRVALARTADGRAELIGTADLGLGQTRISFDSEGPDPDIDPATRLRVQAGPGLRYWVSPGFAVGATTGLRYDSFSQDGELGETSTSNTSLYTSLHMTGVF